MCALIDRWPEYTTQSLREQQLCSIRYAYAFLFANLPLQTTSAAQSILLYFHSRFEVPTCQSYMTLPTTLFYFLQSGFHYISSTQLWPLTVSKLEGNLTYNLYLGSSMFTAIFPCPLQSAWPLAILGSIIGLASYIFGSTVSRQESFRHYTFLVPLFLLILFYVVFRAEKQEDPVRKPISHSK